MLLIFTNCYIKIIKYYKTKIILQLNVVTLFKDACEIENFDHQNEASMYIKQNPLTLQYLTSATTNCPISRRFASRFNKVRCVNVCVDTDGMPRSLRPVSVGLLCVRVTSAARLDCQYNPTFPSPPRIRQQW